MAVVEVVLWVLMGIVLGALAIFLPHVQRRSFWLVAGSGLFSWLGGTAGKFVLRSPTNVESEFSWISLLLAAAGALLFIWYETMIVRPHSSP